MTEDEAKQKWCPMTRSGNAPGCNRADGTDHCVASDCMMWRWSKKGFDGFKTFDQDTGYCGLAGKP